MKHKALTPPQVAGFGRFYRELADLLDVHWKLEVMHLGDIHADGPGIEVTLYVPTEQHFQSLDKPVEKAFERADMPGYSCSGTGVEMEVRDGAQVRDISFHPTRSQPVEGS